MKGKLEKFHFMLFFGLLLFLKAASAITITWTHPKEPPKTAAQIVSAIERHILALEAAQFASKIFNVNVKLCPDPEFDPLIGEFTIPRIIGYSQFYDHECVLGHDPSLQWWGDKEEPKPGKKKVVGEGLSLPGFLINIRRNIQQSDEEVWLLDSDSIRHWFKGKLLYSLQDPKLLSKSFAHLLMRQLNVMNGPDGEKDLKRFPQAVQGSLVVVLPTYSSWKKGFELKRLFDATWWKSGLVLREKVDLEEPLITMIAKYKRPGQLCIIVHEPTDTNNQLIRNLQLQFGENQVISAAKILPKGHSELTLLKFIQKAALVLVDHRDDRGRLVKLSRGSDENTIELYLGKTNLQLLQITLTCMVALIGILTLLYLTNKHYHVSLKEHLIRFGVITMFTLVPIYMLNPSLWPQKKVYFWYGICEAGMDIIVYSVCSLYVISSIITFFAFIFTKKQRIIDQESDDEEIRLIPSSAIHQ